MATYLLENSTIFITHCTYIPLY